jgi:hypothetical protein
MNILILALLIPAALPLETWDQQGEADLRKPAPVIEEHVPGFYWIDAEDFADYGGWKADTQFVHLLGSACLIAPGVGVPVEDATAVFQVSRDGVYRIWVRARDWLPAYHPGRFEVLVNGTPLDAIFGEAGEDGWAWINGGEVSLESGENTIALHDLSGYFARCDAVLITADMDYVPPPGKTGIEKARARFTGLSLGARRKGDFDVVVIGGGPAGCPAAIAAARLGAKTALIQDRPVLGGNASLELGVGMQGASISQRNARESGIIEEASRMRAHNGWHRVTIPFHRLAAAEEKLSLFLNTRVVGVRKDSAGKIVELIGMDTLTGAYTTYGARYVVDCTGDGWAGYYAGAAYRYGREEKERHDEPDAPEKPDEITMSGCIMGRHGIGHLAVASGAPVDYQAPPWASKLHDLAQRRRTPRNLTTGEWWLEHPGTRDDLYDAERARDELIRIAFGYWHYLKNDWPGRETLRNHRLTFVPWIVARRETRRLTGDHVLTAHDALDGTIFPDRISYGGWPVDIHNPDGIYKGDSPYHTNYHIDEMYTIPFRCLYSVNIDNLLFAGRCASFSHFGLGTVRVERTLGTLGQAAGTGAAMCARENITPRELCNARIADLQQILLKYDQFIPEIRNEDPRDLARKARITASSTAQGVVFSAKNVRLKDRCHPMDHKRAFMMPMANGRIGRAVLRMKSGRSDDVLLRLHLRAAEKYDDFSATEDRAVAEARLNAGAEQWVVFEFNREVGTPYAWVWLEPVADVSWRLMQEGLPRMRRAYAAPSAEGPDAWVKAGGFYACYLEPPAMAEIDCAPEKVIDGVARIVGDDLHGWQAAPDRPLPQWLELTFEEPVTFNTVHLTFITDINTRHFGNAAPLSGVSGYHIAIPDGAGWKTLVRETDNCQRWRRHGFPAVSAGSLRIVIEELAACDTAGLFEIRVYNE